MADLSALYPQPTQGGGGFANMNPLQMLMMANQATSLGSDLATGRQIKSATDPGTGQVDERALGVGLSQDPQAVRNMLPTMTALQKLKEAGFQADAAGLQTMQKRFEYLDGQLYPLRGKKDLKSEDLQSVILDSVSHPEANKMGVTLPFAMNLLKQIPKGKLVDGKMQPPDPQELAEYLDRTHANILSARESMKPQPAMVDNGTHLIPMDQNPISPTYNQQVGKAVAKGLPPTTTTVPAGGGQPQYMGAQPGPAPTTTKPGVPGTSGAQPSTVGGPVPGAQGVASAQPPGYGEAMAAKGTASTAAATQLRQAAQEQPQVKSMLGNLEEDLNHFTAGPGADWTKVAKAAINRNVPLPESMKFDPKSIASQEAFVKQATMLAQKQFAAIGGTGTDAKFGSAFETNPNDALSQLGNQGIIRLLKGNADAVTAMNGAWQKWRKTNGPESYDEFAADFAQKFDPRAFQFKYIPEKERQAYVNRMDPEDLQGFKESLDYAHKQGWIKYDPPKGKK